MINNIAIGQYYNATSIIHRLDPRIKVLLALAFIVMVFFVTNFWGYLAVFLFMAATIAMSTVPVKMLINSLKPVIYITIFTFLLNIFFVRGNTVIFSWMFIEITQEGLRQAVFMALRLMFLVMGTSLLTLTTSPIELTDAFERLMKPLTVIRFPAHELAMMMSIALRFIPTLVEETDKIMKAQKARGADFESGNLLKRASAMLPLLVPLFVSAFRRADELALAMESRCYRGAKGRTRMKILKLQPRDAVASACLAAVFALIVVWG